MLILLESQTSYLKYKKIQLKMLSLIVHTTKLLENFITYSSLSITYRD